MKNKIFARALSVILSLPVAVWAVDDVTDVENTMPVVNQLDEDIEISDEENNTEYKQPIGMKSITKKFTSAMGGVLISSFAIYFMLTVYNRFRERFITAAKTPEGKVSLETPETLNDAVKTFLDKTKWE